MRILHVTECYAGGVKRAVEARADASPQFEHHLLWSGKEEPSDFIQWKSISVMPEPKLKALKVLKGEIRRVQPDIIHAHSSWAGFYTRILNLPCPVVYEPHCFKFDDPNLSKPSFLAYRYAEKLLSRRTAAFGALTAYETGLIRKLDSNAKVYRLQNVPVLLESWNELYDLSIDQERSRRYLAMVGRLARQKDPQFFRSVVNEVRKAGSAMEPIWIGDGDTEYRDMLERDGIRVTGWLDSTEVHQLLAESVYVHTASYEGLPLSVLDATVAGAPIIARDIPSLHDLPIRLVETPEEMANLAIAAQAPGEPQKKALEANRLVQLEYNKTTLGASLDSMYRDVVELAPSNRV